MDFGQKFSTVESIAKTLEQLGLGVLLAFVYSYFWTGSAHAMRHKIWRIFYGDARPSNTKIAEYVQDRMDLMALRQETGLHHRTVVQGQRVIQWLQDNDESPEDLKASRKFFDFDRMDFNVDNTKKLGTRRYGVGVLTLALVVFAGISAVASDRVYYRIKDTGRWFSSSVREESVRDLTLPWQKNSWIDKTQCSDPADLVPTGEYSAKDLATICLFLANKTDVLQKSLREQRWAFGLLAAEALIIWLILLFSLRKRQQASRMLERVLARRALAAGA